MASAAPSAKTEGLSQIDRGNHHVTRLMIALAVIRRHVKFPP